jgi:hypothetical protein
VHVLVGVLGPVVMGVWVLVRDVLVVVRGVGVGVRLFAVSVFVRVGCVVGVWFCHSVLSCGMCYFRQPAPSRVRGVVDVDSRTAFSSPWPRW